jgi:hypothetical protein
MDNIICEVLVNVLPGGGFLRGEEKCNIFGKLCCKHRIGPACSVKPNSAMVVQPCTEQEGPECDCGGMGAEGNG